MQKAPHSKKISKMIYTRDVLKPTTILDLRMFFELSEEFCFKLWNQKSKNEISFLFQVHPKKRLDIFPHRFAIRPKSQHWEYFQHFIELVFLRKTIFKRLHTWFNHLTWTAHQCFSNHVSYQHKTASHLLFKSQSSLERNTQVLFLSFHASK